MLCTNNYLLKVENLKTYFPVKKGLLRRTVGFVKAVDGISFGIKKGQTLGLVGESGCGKTTVAKTIARLVPATAGRVIFKQEEVLSADRPKLRRLRRQISLIFQDSLGSLNPKMTVGSIIGEPIRFHKGTTGSELTERVATLLCKVGLSPDCMNRYPHQLSGGQRQRVDIARALSLEPRLVICDEPVSALDVSIRAQILNLLKDLQQELGLTYLFIAHDLAVVEFFADYVAVMYMGRIVEQAPVKQLYRNPLHPYTHALLSSVPQIQSSRHSILDARYTQRESRICREAYFVEHTASCFLPDCCVFSQRCLWCRDDCLKRMPALQESPEHKGHFVACWKYL
jgi:oligopeptide transport system ATP-binding protein